MIIRCDSLRKSDPRKNVKQKMFSGAAWMKKKKKVFAELCAGLFVTPPGDTNNFRDKKLFWGCLWTTQKAPAACSWALSPPFVTLPMDHSGNVKWGNVLLCCGAVLSALWALVMTFVSVAGPWGLIVMHGPSLPRR